MGKGKGSFSKFVFRLNCFSPLFFLHNVSLIFALRILNQIEYKLPISLCLFSVTKLYVHKFVPLLDSRVGYFSSFSFSYSGVIRYI